MKYKVYTKTGDAGETALFGGRRVAKDHIRITAYGTVDELNAHLGLLSAYCAAAGGLAAAGDFLRAVQAELFTVGAQLATPPNRKLATRPLDAAATVRIEGEIDRLDAELPALSSFILPAGGLAVAQCHVARTVARRAERDVVALAHVHSVAPELITYLNRLSDYLFVLARSIAQALGEAETTWRAPAA